ncbi:MAG: methylmalonyl-CoA mutase beta subunit [Caulobacteraceae bacterium]|nr:methylmalonyl-CoA mutase beta subunit [Caulobacteraceae bacterium]
MTTSTIPLADGFPAATRADWLALVAKTLKGAGVETLVGRTADGLELDALYTDEDGAAALPFAPAPRGGERGWDVRARVAASEPALANREALDALAGGAGSILIKLDSGAGGVAVTSAGDLDRVLAGVEAELAPIALDAGFLGTGAADWLHDVAKASPRARLAFHLDPLSAFAATGASPGPIAAHVSAAAALAATLAETYPTASLFLASGGVVHEAGGSPAWELAFAAAAAVAYARALVGAGLSMADAFGRLTLGLHVDAEPLAAMAKLRAARVVWTRIVRACGTDVPARIEARSSGRMLTRADRWTNLIRLTSAGFGAAVGGADAVVLGAFTDALNEGSGAPADAFALRLARNTQLMLMEEAQLGRVADPAGGSWALEAQTDDLARAAWEAFVAIEVAGGLAAALKGEIVADAVARSREALKGAIDDRAMRIIGVTDFLPAEETPQAAAAAAPSSAPPAARQPGPDDACPPLTPIRLEEMAT